MTRSTSVDPLDIALRVAAAIEACGGEYFVGGSVASSLQGDPRATNDIDFVISLPLGKVEALRDTLGSDFELDVTMLREALQRASTANAFYLPLVTKIDFFGRGYQPFDAAEFARRRPVPIRPSGETLVIKTPEDTVLRKLLWYRAGGEVSDRQWRDISSVLRISGPQMDATYLDSWAKRLSVSELLARAQSEAGA
jgi:hypothetical protein